MLQATSRVTGTKGARAACPIDEDVGLFNRDPTALADGQGAPPCTYIIIDTELGAVDSPSPHVDTSVPAVVVCQGALKASDRIVETSQHARYSITAHGCVHS